jgi:hypothetical protein
VGMGFRKRGEEGKEDIALKTQFLPFLYILE